LAAARRGFLDDLRMQAFDVWNMVPNLPEETRQKGMEENPEFFTNYLIKLPGDQR